MSRWPGFFGVWFMDNECDQIDRAVVSLMTLKQSVPANARYAYDANYHREKVRLCGLLIELLGDSDLSAVAETAQEEIERRRLV